MNKKRRQQIGFAAASVGATAGLMLLVLPLVPQVSANLDNAAVSEMGMANQMPVPHVMRYGAIAYSPSTGAWGTSRGYQVKSQAERVALDQCGENDCRVIISFNLCGAVASDGSNYQGGTGLSRQAAEQDALNRLGGGRVVNSVCN
ncbi:DUF4189 domain-containing protein [Mycobacterium kiyosense]|jgi:hypothetical protein|uniref:DUF4189 domain-containing protein n=1 Tax=Mycobacterium kiyosense TaxID=2871094 RepID=A0AA37Q3I4_9MYCO|nr:DUF4189 domain-containing protein [Mycobacterium kiyosense]GLB86783.1 hypothetical protein SRL2020028_60390 [Mycobacterium kiyosense]GLB99355.1 hypothetical protein SRL2020226_61310 [Mycobacterium kiyosense]